MYIDSQGKQELLIYFQVILKQDINEKIIIKITNILEHDIKKLGSTWYEYVEDEIPFWKMKFYYGNRIVEDGNSLWKKTATVTIN